MVNYNINNAYNTTILNVEYKSGAPFTNME